MAKKEKTHAELLEQYFTPAWVVSALLPHIPLGGTVLDPAAGMLHLLEPLLYSGVKETKDMFAIEIDGGLVDKWSLSLPVGHAIHADALEDRNDGEPWWPATDLIVMNPPFSKAVAFLERAFEAVKFGGTVAALLRLSFLDSKGRLPFHLEHQGDMVVLSERPSFIMPDEDGGKGTDTATVAWFIYGPGRGGRYEVV